MATSGSFSKVFATGYTLQVSWSESNVDISANQSDLTVTVKLVTASSYNINSTAAKNISLTINGTTYSGTCTVGISGGSSKTLMTKTVSNITHGSDGSKSVAINCTLGIAVTLNGSYISSVSTSGTATLTKIARASSLSVSNGTLGTTQTLVITKQNSGFTHTITYKCGTASGTICTKSGDTSYSFTPPLTLAYQNTSGTSVSVTFTLQTYSGSTAIGSAVSKTVSMAITASVKPSCTVTVTDDTGYFDIYGGYVQGKSKLKITVTPTLAYGSAIASYTITADGNTFTTSPAITPEIASSGNLTVNATVKDKRARIGTAAETVTVLPYANPEVTKLTVHRCNSDGTENQQGENVKVTYSGKVSELNYLNTVLIVLKYKKATDTEYTSVIMYDSTDISANDYEITDWTYIFSADSGSTYNVQIELTDAFGTDTKSTTASTAFTIMHWLASGLGMAIGKIAELENFLEIGFQTLFHKAVIIKNNVGLYLQNSNGENRNAMHMDMDNNFMIGYGGYDSEEGITNIFGHDVNIGVSNVANRGLYKPYYSRGDSFSLTLYTAGFVTNSKTEVCFWLPLSKPIVGSPTVTVTSLNGFILRQNNTYTHGSSASVYAKPDSYSTWVTAGSGVYIKATFSDITNAINNNPIGIGWNGQITFS